MQEYNLLRRQLLETLLQMEEKLKVENGNDSNQKIGDIVSNNVVNSYPNGSTLDKVMFSVLELSEYLGVSTDSIYTMVRENQIPFVRIRRRILFYRESINAWICSNTSKN
ncbi:helix-turn-helix domain-containing protein [Paenibacillus agaridevorans]|uniref:helix-turn-helix domain-containing protein n=1 Tax=Paenibacillus agaridevorans TaxID=171404 RepID=UPI0031BAE576